MRFLIIDGDYQAAQELLKILSDAYPNSEILGQLDSVEASVRWLNEHPLPDLIFMDVQLADGTAFEVFEKITVEKPIVFTATSDRFALKAFAVNAVGYLLKPLHLETVQRVVEKFYRFHFGIAKNSYDTNAHPSEEQHSPRFLIRFGQNFRLVDLNVAAFFYTENKITFIVTKEGKRYPIQHSLEKLEELADPQSFFRINRQFIVNVGSIKSMSGHTKSRVKLKLDPCPAKETIVSSERSPIFKKWLVEQAGN